VPNSVKSLESPSSILEIRTDCLKRAGIRANGIERKLATWGEEAGMRPVREPRTGWVKVWMVKGGPVIFEYCTV
jgi:hypothetical protein